MRAYVDVVFAGMVYLVSTLRNCVGSVNLVLSLIVSLMEKENINELWLYCN